MKQLIYIVLVFLLPLVSCGKSPEPAARVTERTPAITGTVAYRERMALSPEAVVEIRLLDVSRQDVPAETLAIQRIVKPGQVPISFELIYDPTKIDPRMSYALQAKIFDRGRLMYINDSRVSVLTRGAGHRADMMLVRVEALNTGPEGNAPAAAALQDTYWKLVELDGQPVTTREGMREAHIVLDATGTRAHGHAGCNDFFGTYESGDGTLTFSHMGSTMKACLEEMDTERAFLNALQSATRYDLRGQTLELYNGEQLLARFEAV